MVKIGIIERNFLLSRSYADFFEALADYEICFQVTSVKELFQQPVSQTPIDVLIIDLPASESDANCLRSLKNAAARIIFFTSRSDIGFILECLKSGADGYLLKTDGLFELHQAIKETMQEGLVISPLITRQLVRHIFSDHHTEIPLHLTNKEKAIINLVKEGLSYKQMAEEMKVTPFTINHHLKKIYKKSGVNSRSQLMVLLQRHAES